MDFSMYWAILEYWSYYNLSKTEVIGSYKSDNVRSLIWFNKISSEHLNNWLDLWNSFKA